MNIPQPVLQRPEIYKRDQRLVHLEGESNVGRLKGCFQRSLRKRPFGVIIAFIIHGNVRTFTT